MNELVRPVTYALQHNGFEIGVHPEDPDFEHKTQVCIATYPSNGYFATVKIYKSDSITKGFIEINEFLADHLEFIKNGCVHYTEALLITDIHLTHDENNKEMKNTMATKNERHLVVQPMFDPKYFIINDAYQVFDKDRVLLGNMILRTYQPTCLSFTRSNGDYYNIHISEYENGDRDFVHLVPENDVSVNDEI